jgi:acyl-coenzyme A thioesterase PaaI-like protein
MKGGCYGCGDDNPVGLRMQFVTTDEGVTATFWPKEFHQGAPGFLHGGVAATALDETMAAVGWLVDGQRMVTGTLELRYRRPVPLDGLPLTIHAWSEGPSRRHRRMHGRLLLADDEVAVEASGIFVSVGAVGDEP